MLGGLVFGGLSATPPLPAAGTLPIMGFTTWCQSSCGDLWVGSPFNVSAAAIRRAADRLVSTGLRDAGYTYVLLDDGWPACAEVAQPGDLHCVTPAPRLPNGDVLVDALKFPPSAPAANDGLKLVADYLHSRGLHLGIYTAPGPKTCGGYTGIFEHERGDVAQFAAAGIDFIKADSGCGDATSLHDGTVLGSLRRVGEAINATGLAGTMLFYIDQGNSNEAAVWNPHGRGVVDSPHARSHVPRALAEEVWSYGPSVGASMWKIWADRFDTFGSLLGNVHASVVAGIPFRQQPGAITTLDAMTIGRAATPTSMTAGQQRVEVILYAMLSSPMVLSFDLGGERGVPPILLNEQLIAIDQDPDVTAASLIESTGRNPWGTDLWIKPLHDGTFAVALVNKDAVAHTMHVDMATPRHTFGPFTGGPDPGCSVASVRDVLARQELGNFSTSFSTSVAAGDGRLLRFTFCPSVA